MGFSSREVMFFLIKKKKNILRMAASPWLLLHEIESYKNLQPGQKLYLLWTQCYYEACQTENTAGNEHPQRAEYCDLVILKRLDSALLCLTHSSAVHQHKVDFTNLILHISFKASLAFSGTFKRWMKWRVVFDIGTKVQKRIWD